MLIPNSKLCNTKYDERLISIYSEILERNWIANNFFAENTAELLLTYGSLKKADRRFFELCQLLDSHLEIIPHSYNRKTIEGITFNRDDYVIDVHTPVGHKEYSLTIDFKENRIYGDVSAYGETGHIDSYEYLALALIVDASYMVIRNYEELFYSENNKFMLVEGCL